MKRNGIFLRYHFWLLCPIIVFYYLLSIITIKHFPLVSVDDGWQWNNALLWVRKDFVSINHPFFDTKVGLPYIMDFLLGLVGKFWGVGLFEGRILILSLSLIVLLLLYLLAKRIYGSLPAFWTIIFLISTDTFLSGSRLIRNEMLLGVFLLTWAHFFYWWLKTRRRTWLILASLALAFGVDAHQNSAIFFLASIFVLAFVIRKPLKERVQTFAIYLIGPLFYSIYYLFAHVLPDKEAFWFLNRYSAFIDHPMPIFALEPTQIFLAEVARYVNYFGGARIVEFLVILASLFYIVSKRKVAESFLAWFILFTLILLFPFAANKLPQYFVIIYLFSALFVGKLISLVFLLSWQKLKNLKREIKTNVFQFSFTFLAKSEFAKVMYLFSISLIILFFCLNTFRTAVRLKNFSSHDIDSLGEEITQLISPDDKVVGLPYWMLALPNHRLVSSYTLTWFRVIEGEELKDALEEISPDILIVDKYLRGYLTEDRRLITNQDFQSGLYFIYKPELLAVLANNGKLIGRISDNFLGPIEVYKLNSKR